MTEVKQIKFVFDDDKYLHVIEESWAQAEEELEEELATDTAWNDYQEAVKEHQEFCLDKVVVTC